jgi:hypothetical protein
MADHDQRLKVILRECLAEAVQLIHSPWAQGLLFDQSEWLQQELFPDPPAGERRSVDLVARVPHQSHDPLLIHLEVETAEALTSLRQRMPRYHHYLWTRYNAEVLSLAVYAQVALQGNGFDESSHYYFGERIRQTRWPYLGLPGLDGVRYVEEGNLLACALVGFMRVPEADRPRVKAEALRKLAEANISTLKRYLLMECVEAYLPLDGPLMQQYQHLLVTQPEYQTVIRTGKTTREEGIEFGEERAQRRLVQRQLTRKFGPLSSAVQARLDALTMPQLDVLAEELLDAKSLAELGLEDAPAQGGS